MHWKVALASRLRALFTRARIEPELDAERRFHLEQQIEENLAAAMSVEDARASALRAIGSVTLIKDQARESLGVRLIDELRQDLRYACRGLLRNPGFTLVGVLTLGLGIGATATLFSVAYGVLLKPLPWADADQLVRVTETRGGRVGRVRGTLMNGTYVAWAEHPSTIEGLGGWLRLEAMTMTLRGATEARRVAVVPVTPSLFPMLRGRPVIGRLFAANEGARGVPRVALLSFGLWQEEFGGRGDVLGREIRLDDQSFTIVGVMARDFAFPTREARLWTAWAVPDVAGGGVQTGVIFSAMARLRAGSTSAQAAAEATARARAGADADVVAMALFGAKGPIDVQVTAARDALVADVRPAITLLLLAGGLLLATATANVAGLQLARASSRAHEIGVRVAIGAAALRLMRQFLVEGVVLGIAGGALGLTFVMALHRVLPMVIPADFPRLEAVGVDGRVVLFAIALTMTTSILCGMVPAVQAWGINLTASLSGGGSPERGSAGARTARARMVIMVGQVAVVCVLLMGAALLTRSFRALVHADRGYDPINLLTARLPVPLAYSPERRTALVESLIERVRALPGVTHAAVSNALPFVSEGGFAAFRMASMWDPGVELDVQAAQRVVTPEYFEALRLRIVSGRGLTAADSGMARPAIVVNRSFARAYLGDRLAGPRIPVPKGGRAGLRFRNAEADWEVVGVVEDMRQDRVDAPLQPEIFMAFEQVLPANLQRFEPIIVLRTASDPVSFIGPLRAIVGDVAPSLALDSVMTMEERVAWSLARPRAYALLVGGFAVSALTIAGVGLFGVLSFLVARRSREIGVRTALGAQRRDVMMLVLRQALGVAIVGFMIGLWGSFALRHYVVTLLYGVTPGNLGSVVAVGAIVIGAALVASWAPARRATRVDPLVALRSE